MRTINRDIVAALLISKDDKILQVQKYKDKGGVYAEGCWHIPGGGVKEGEAPLSALQRKIQEEVGIDISSYTVTLIDSEGEGEAEKVLADGERVHCHMKFKVYSVSLHGASSEIPVHLSAEHSNYRWSTKEDLKHLTLTPPSVELFTRLGFI